MSDADPNIPRPCSPEQATGSGYNTSGFYESHGDGELSAMDTGLGRILLVGNLCNNAHLRDGHLIGSPTEGALLVAASKFGLPDMRDSWERIAEIPFTSETKWMAVRCREAGRDPIYFVKVCLGRNGDFRHVA